MLSTLLSLVALLTVAAVVIAVVVLRTSRRNRQLKGNAVSRCFNAHIETD